ncbi:Dihydrofolate reductase type 3 [Gracilariopsis chorda]|uniref:dihydrofolate reductase n=1 Tax=Gracilariopsis chorda TaxID=448386 RepID=A0A2V3IPW9_9FLOR|nr:Dihydrofolate reductase type 3 [Gracilariopsis chorda]|eukprot:PXF44135.1 Dihydrofolate reductase type 3 [Gracilariopsis chorda]
MPDQHHPTQLSLPYNKPHTKRCTLLSRFEAHTFPQHNNAILAAHLRPRASVSPRMQKPIISLVVAYTRVNRVIGIRDALPWPRLQADMRRFAKLTYYHAIIMGRKTFESDPINSSPLPHRRNIVLSRNPVWIPPQGVLHAFDWDEALLLADSGFGAAGYHDGSRMVRTPLCNRHIFVLGGQSVYKLALDRGCQWVFATEIDGQMPGDSFFPELPSSEWDRVPPSDCPRHWASEHQFREKGYTFSFVTYKRKDHPYLLF